MRKNMAENPYSKKPLQVLLYDPCHKTVTGTYVFLGSVPKNVHTAANRGDNGKWAPKDERTLSAYYGSGWRRLLIPKPWLLQPQQQEPRPAELLGGQEALDFGNLDDFDDIDILIEEGKEEVDSDAFGLAPTTREAEPPAPSLDTPLGERETGYSEIATYPEDTFADLKAKIYAASGIPPYRQHLFFVPPGQDRPHTTYRITIEGVFVLIDVRDAYAHDGAAAYEGAQIAGVPIDRRLEARKDDLRVEALDSFTRLELAPGAYVRQVYVADLFSVIRPKHSGATSAALQDRYQFDLLYYGAVLKFWPQLSPDAFQLVMASSEEAALYDVYPALYPARKTVQSRVRLQQELVDRTYARAAQVEAAARRDQARSRRPNVAVTAATVTVRPPSGTTKITINIRNVFDWIATSPTLPAVIARFHVSTRGELLARADVSPHKRHMTSHRAGIGPVLDRYIAHRKTRLRRPSVSFAIVRSPPARRQQRAAPAPAPAPKKEELVYLTIQDDGKYTIEGTWREDNRMGFKEASRQLLAAPRALIKQINGMGPAAFPHGGALEVPRDSAEAHVSLGGLTASIFWPHGLTSEGFRELKERWRAYEQAGIVGIKGLQQAGAYTFLFRKGIVDYDTRALERVVAYATPTLPGAALPPRGKAAPGTRVAISNTYVHLTDPVMAQRWNHVYAGRTVRVHHRATDLEVQVVKVNSEEFELVRRYFFVFLEGLIRGPARLTRGLIEPGRGAAAPPQEARLKRLQELDPDLFDLKKFDEDATVYSVLCQAGRQPHVYSKEDAKRLPAGIQKRLVPYWNFTEGRVAYYDCPSSSYPNLYFKAGDHPLGYCLPCCKKTKAIPGTKNAFINEVCLERHQWGPAEEDELRAELSASGHDDPFAQSRHVLAYGKTIPLGRLANVPREISTGLFYNTLPSPLVYRLAGVRQSVPAVPDAGFMYAIAAALLLTLEELTEALIRAVLAIEDTYHALHGGTAAVFPSATHLADAFTAAFLQKAPEFSPFGPGGEAENSWQGIVADLVRILYGVEVVVFADERADGTLVLEASPTTRTVLQGGQGEVIVLFSGPMGTYPLFAMDQKLYLREPPLEGLARRIFAQTYEEEHVLRDGVANILKDMIEATSATRHSVTAISPMDLSLVLRFVQGSQRWSVVTKLINDRDMCYGVLLEHDRPRSRAYIPVVYSSHYMDGHSAHYGPRPEESLPQATLHIAVREINQFIAETQREKSQLYSEIVPAAILMHDGKAVGFVGETHPQRLYYYHDPAQPDLANGLFRAPGAPIELPYLPRVVDDAIYALRGAEASQAELVLAVSASRALHRNYLYRLFVAEFAARLQEERNDELRATLGALIRGTRFGSAASLAEFRRKTAELLREHPGDLAAFRSLVSNTYHRSQGVDGSRLPFRKALLVALEATLFGFDRVTLRRLRELGEKEGKPAVERELAVLMTPLITVEEDSKTPPLANLYVACSAASNVYRPQCSTATATATGTERAVLTIPEGKFGALVDVLAADVLNPMKATTLAVMASGVMDELDFISRPGERVALD